MPPCPSIRSAVHSLVTRLAPRPRPSRAPSSSPPRCDSNASLRQQRSYATTQQERQRDDTYCFRPAFSRAATAAQRTDSRKRSIDYSAYEAVLEGDQDVSEPSLSEKSLTPTWSHSRHKGVSSHVEDSGEAICYQHQGSRIAVQDSAQNGAESTMWKQERTNKITHNARARAFKHKSMMLTLRRLRRICNASAASLRQAKRTRNAHAIYKRDGVWALEAVPKVRRKMIWLSMTKDQRRRVAINQQLRARKRKGLPLQTQLLSVAGPSRVTAIVSTGWTTQFANVSQLLNSTSTAQLRRKWRVLRPQTHTLARLVQNHVRESSRDSGRGALTMADFEVLAKRLKTTPHELWAAIALWKLVNRPRGIAEFLIETHNAPYPPINWVEDCLQFAAMRTRKMTTLSVERKSLEATKLVQALPKLVARDTGEHLAVDSSLIAILLPYASAAAVNDIWHLIKIGRMKVRWPTLLRLARWFCNRNYLDRALDATLESTKAGVQVNSNVFLSFCSLLLRRSMRQSDGLRVTLRIIENMVSIGVKLNRQLCNIVMLNAIEAGDEGTMSAVHRSAVEQGLEPNEHTYAILLKACKRDISNGDRLREVIQAAIASGHVRGNAVVATEILHSLALHHTLAAPREANDDPYRPLDRIPTPTAVTAVLEAYCQLFDPAPLERIGIAMPVTRVLDPSHQRLPSPPHAITIVMAVYLEQSLRPELVAQWYTRFRALAEGGDKELLACLGSEHLSNIFLRKFCKTRRSLLHATTVIKDMQRPLDPALLSAHGVQQAQPNVYTWSIFLEGFARHGQTKLAQQVIDYMRKKGIEPNHVTWTSLLGGYARARDGEKVLDTLRRLDASGAAVNEWTQGQLGRFRDKDRLKDLMARRRYEQSLDFTRDIRQGLVSKISQVGGPVSGDDQSTAFQDDTPIEVGEGRYGDSAGDMAHVDARESNTPGFQVSR